MEDADLGRQLMEWAKKMNYTPPPGKPFPDVSMFQKLCKGKTIPIWKKVIESVRPAEEVQLIRKTQLLQQVKASEPGDIKCLSGPLGQKVQLKLKIEAQEKRKKELLDHIQLLEESICNRKRALVKSVTKRQNIKHEKEECQRKLTLLRLKKCDVLGRIRVIKDMTLIADGVCPLMDDKGVKSASVSVQKCMDALQKFHSSKGKEVEEDRQNAIWRSVISNVDGLTMQSLWSAITQLMSQQVTEISSAAASVSVHPSTNEWNSSKLWGSSSNEHLSVLNAIYVEKFLEGVLLKAKLKMKYLECDQLLDNLVAEVMSEKNVGHNISPEEVKKWVKLHFKKAELLATLEKIKMEVSSRKQNLPNLSEITSELRTSKDTLLRLECDIASEKKYIESSLGTISRTSENLNSAKTKVCARLKMLRSYHQQLLDKQNEKGVCTNLAVPDTCCRDSYRERLSSTLIGDISASSNITLNISGFSTLSSVSCDTQKTALSQFISFLRDAVSKEVRKFFKLPLGTISSVICDGMKIPECRLVVRGPSLASHVLLSSSDSSIQNLLYVAVGAPTVSAPHILLKLLSSSNHNRALFLNQIINNSKFIPTLLYAPMILESLSIHSRQEESLKLRVQDTKALLEDVLAHLHTCKETSDIWFSGCVQDAVPSSLLLKGKPFSVWRKEYNSLKGQSS